MRPPNERRPGVALGIAACASLAVHAAAAAALIGFGHDGPTAPVGLSAVPVTVVAGVPSPAAEAALSSVDAIAAERTPTADPRPVAAVAPVPAEIEAATEAQPVESDAKVAATPAPADEVAASTPERLPAASRPAPNPPPPKPAAAPPTPRPVAPMAPSSRTASAARAASLAAPRAAAEGQQMAALPGTGREARPSPGNPSPDYPERARRRGDEGTVVLRVAVAADGRTTAVEIAKSSGFRILDDAARAAVRRWRFEPARTGGTAVAAHVRVPVRFELKR